MTDNEAEVRAFFERFEQLFNAALRQETPAQDLASLYTEMFIAADADGVDGAMNGPEFIESLEESFQYYRVVGTRGMAAEGIEVTPIDEHHAMARVRWRTDYQRPSDRQELSTQFDVVYLLQKQQDWRVFAYISGDEEAGYRKAGLTSDG